MEGSVLTNVTACDMHFLVKGINFVLHCTHFTTADNAVCE